MKKFVTKRYIMQNAINNRQFHDYVQIVIRFEKSTKLFLFNQLIQIWNKLDSNFQLHVKKFTRNTWMSDFLHELNDKKIFWWKLIVVQIDIDRRNE